MATLPTRETSDCYLGGDEETGKKGPLKELNEEANRERAQKLLEQVRASMEFEERERSAKDVFTSVCKKYLSAEEIASMGKSLMLPREGLIESLDVYGFGISSTTDTRWRTHKKDLIEGLEKYFDYDSEMGVEQISFSQWAMILGLFADPSDEELLSFLFQTLDHDNNGYLMEDDIARLILIQDRISHSLGLADPDSEPVRINLEELMMISLQLLKDADSVIKDGQLSWEEFKDYYASHHSKRVTGAIRSKHKGLLDRAKQDSESSKLTRERVSKRTDQVKASGTVDATGITEDTAADSTADA